MVKRKHLRTHRYARMPPCTCTSSYIVPLVYMNLTCVRACVQRKLAGHECLFHAGAVRDNGYRGAFMCLRLWLHMCMRLCCPCMPLNMYVGTYSCVCGFECNACVHSFMEKCMIYAVKCQLSVSLLHTLL